MRRPPARRLSWSLALLAAIGGGARAADVLEEFQRARAQGQATTIVEIDNDTFLLNHSDGFYTSGLRVERSFTLDRHPETAPLSAGTAPRSADPAPRVAGAGPLLAGMAPLSAGAMGEAVAPTIDYGWRVGQALYTASDIKLPPVLVGPPDHPYAGWLYGGVFRQASRANGARWRAGLDLGCLGSCALGRETQSWLHRATGQPLPQGWSRQVNREFGALLYADLDAPHWRPATGLAIVPGVSARFGNIHADLAARLVVRLGAPAPPPGRDLAWQGFARVEARAVGYDASLQGGYFSRDNPHVVTPKRLVDETELGLRLAAGKLAWSVSIVRTGNEIAALPYRLGAQNFARLQLAIQP